MRKLVSTMILVSMLYQAMVPSVLAMKQSAPDTAPAAPTVPKPPSVRVTAVIPDTFAASDTPSFSLSQELTLPTRIANFILNALRLTGSLKHITVKNPTGAIVYDQPFVDTTADVRLALSSFVPGVYSVDVDGSPVDTFSWGVLAINPDKSIYTSGEPAHLAMAVLDSRGMMVCDATVTLLIRDPNGNELSQSTKDRTIRVNDACTKHSATTVPDYESTYQTTAPGIYHLTLTAETSEGSHTITDSFRAEQSPTYSVQRKMATRLYPISTYTPQILITAAKDFDGSVTETVPAAFTVSKSGTVSRTYTSVEKRGDLQYIHWNVSLRAGQTEILEYTFDPPDASPDFFLAGPLTIKNQLGITAFTETRRWQMANDAPSDYSFQRKTWYDGTQYWRAYNDTANSRIRFDYSTDGVTWTENATARITVNTNDFSVYGNSSNAFIVYTNGFDIEARKASTYPGTTFGWSAATIVYDGTSASDFYSYPTITLDSNNKVWTAAYYKSNFTVNAQVASASDDGADIAGDSTFHTIGNPDISWGSGCLSGSNCLSYGGKGPTGSVITTGLRFTGLSIPKGVTITSATFDVKNQWSGNYGANVKDSVYGALTANISTFSNSNLPRSITKTSASASWNSVSESIATDTWFSATASNQPPSITSVVQEIVNQSSWTESSAMGLILTDNGSTNDWWYEGDTYENAAANAAKLQVTYTGNKIMAIQSTSANDISAWGTASAVNNSANTNKYAVIVPRTSGTVQAIYMDGTTISSKNYNGSSWDSSPTYIATGKTGLTQTLAATSDTSGNVHISYIDSNGYTYYREYTGSWQKEVLLDGGTTNSSPTISYDSSTGDVYAFWIRSNTLYYSRGQSTYTKDKWSSSPTSWKTGTSLSALSSDVSAAGKIFAEWYDGSAVQWDIVGVPKTNFRIQTGYYVGTGTDNLAITGVGFQPKMVIIKDDTANGSNGIFWKSSVMSGESSSVLADSAADTALGAIKSLDSDGFTLGTNADVNTLNIRFTWIAFAGSDCTATGTFCVGSYTGTGANLSVTSVGFRPDFVAIKRAGGSSGVFHTSSMPDNYTYFYGSTAPNTTGTMVKTLDATGFSIGNSTTVNTSADTHWYFAFRNSKDFAVGSFTGDATDNKSVTVGFKPSAVFIKNSNAVSLTAAYYNIPESYGDYSTNCADASNLTGVIKSLTTTGFTVGTAAAGNDSAQTIYWYAFGGEVDRTASGTFKLAVGSYTGNGTSQSVTGLGFSPDVVIVRDQTGANYAVIRTRLMKGDTTSYITTGVSNFAGGVTSLDADGFSVGADVTVNTNATTYVWQAFGNAFNPETGSGAADFAIGAYTGNALDNRNIIRQAFQPDVVLVRKSAAQSQFRTSSMSGDVSAYLTSTADTSDTIQAINGDGFQIGTTSLVNSAGSVHYFVLFKAGVALKVGTYTGTGSTLNVTSPGIAPTLVWVKGTDANVGSYRPSSNVGDITENFSNSATVTNRITGMLSNGFTVGTNAVVNTAGITYRYVVWKSNASPGIPTLVSPADTSTGVSVTPRFVTSATDADGDYLRYKITICTDSGMTTGCQTLNQTTTQAGWDNQNTQSASAYTSGSQATYLLQTALSASTTYYWKSYAIDPAGSNSFGSTQASPFSFTTGATPVKTEFNGLNMSGMKVN